MNPNYNSTALNVNSTTEPPVRLKREEHPSIVISSPSKLKLDSDIASKSPSPKSYIKGPRKVEEAVLKEKMEAKKELHEDFNDVKVEDVQEVYEVQHDVAYQEVHQEVDFEEEKDQTVEEEVPLSLEKP